MVLNPELFARLKDKFGEVQVVRPNEPYRPNWVTDPISGRKVRGAGTVSGEAYRLSCPYCGDTKGRLYVNHCWMQWDNDAMRSADDMIRCFNETNCFGNQDNRSKFYSLVYSNSLWLGEKGIVQSNQEEVKPPEPEPPGTVVRLSEMSENQPCVAYLKGRGYSIKTLEDWWNIGYVTSVKWGHHPDCLNRIYIPMSYKGELVGYQCRYIGDREWTAECPKYRTMRRMPRGRYLYNYDVAIRGRVLVVVEGPTSAWMTGPRSTALWSKSISKDQVNLIRTGWRDDCLVAVMLDGEAVNESLKITAQLKANCDCRVVRVPLAFREDPGKLGESSSWAAIDSACRESGIQLSDFLTGENRVEVS